MLWDACLSWCRQPSSRCLGGGAVTTGKAGQTCYEVVQIVLLSHLIAAALVCESMRISLHCWCPHGCLFCCCHCYVHPLCKQGFDDYALVKLACNLTNLKRLSINGATEVTDLSLVAVGQLLRQLTELELSNCKLTDKGVQQLMGLPQLLVLEAMGVVDVSMDAVAAVLRAASSSRAAAATRAADIAAVNAADV